VASASGDIALPRVPNLIGGSDAAPASGQWILKRSPADGQPSCELARSCEPDVDAAVAAARDSQPAWAEVTPVQRGNILRRAAELMQEHASNLVNEVCRETGKPPRDARGELGGAIEMGYFMAGEGRRLYGRTTTSAVPNKTVSFVRAPVGVAGLIVASNTPLPNYAWKVFPALVCGNAVVLKPSEDTPGSAHHFAHLLHEAGLPSGVLNVVQGLGGEAGAALVANPGVDLISFTGSSAVGRAIQIVAGGRLAKVCLELGGKNPLVVCDDADLKAAARAAVLSAFSNAGQRCAAGSRIIVFDHAYEEFRDLLATAAEKLRVGVDDAADLGPVINERQLSRILDAITGVLQRGGNLLAGGHRLTGPPYYDGCYLQPTLIEQVEADDSITATELFGPVASLYRVANFDQALTLANASPYGLTAAVYTASLHRAMEFTRRVQAGMVVVNGPTYGSEPHMPFGGFKESGNGFREAGTEGLDVFSEWKSIAIIHDRSLA